MNPQPHDIQVLALDVDGVLTDGTFRLQNTTEQEMKSFHVQDGLGLSLWKKSGCEVVLISGRSSEVVSRRADELGITHVIQGSKDKVADLQTALDKIGVSTEQTAFVGDDLGDLAVMQHVGFSIAVHDAVAEVRSEADWITARNGGHGAVRDAVEYLMKSMGTWETAIQTLSSEPAPQ